MADKGPSARGGFSRPMSQTQFSRPSLSSHPSTPPSALVIGAGPAGSATATFLSRMGWQVRVVDRRGGVEQKICGECLSPSSLGFLQLLGADTKIAPSAIQQLEGIRLVGPKGSFCDLDFGEAPPFSIPRPILDQALVDTAIEAGAHIEWDTTVTQIQKQKQGTPFRVTLSGKTKLSGEIKTEITITEITPDFIVGADGRNSWTAKELGLAKSRSPSLQHAAVMTYFSPPETPLRKVEMHVCPWGYVGLNPVSPDQVNVIAVLPPPLLRERLKGAGKSGLTSFLYEHILGSFAPHSLKQRMRGANSLSDQAWSVSPLAWSPLKLTGDRCALVGDSAGFVDPFTGEGLYHALASAHQLSLQLSQNKILEGLRNYESWHRTVFGPEEKFCSLLQKLLPYSTLTDYGIRQLGKKPKLNAFLAEAIADRLPTEKVLSPWFWGKVLLP